MAKTNKPAEQSAQKAVKFKHAFFEGGIPKYEANKVYPATEETMRQVALGHADEVDAEAGDMAEDETASDDKPTGEAGAA